MSDLQAEVLTTTGREFVQQRLFRVQEEAARIELQLRSERTPDLVAEHWGLLREVAELRALLARALDVSAVGEDPNLVELGDEVDVEERGRVLTYALVHPAEAGSTERPVTADSPLGRALLGARPGDTVTVEAPRQTYSVTVLQRRRLL